MGLSGSCLQDEKANWPLSSGGVADGVELADSGELAPHRRGDDGTVPGAELTTATLASRALARELGERQRSREGCMGTESATVTAGGVTEGGVSGGRRLAGQAVGMRGAGSEMNMDVESEGGWSSETAANLDDDELPSDDRLLLFEVMARRRGVLVHDGSSVAGGELCCGLGAQAGSQKEGNASY